MQAITRINAATSANIFTYWLLPCPGREVYSLFVMVAPGNSGGPLLAPDGTVIGVVFAASLDDPQTGYALTSAEVSGAVATGATARAAVGTGPCTR